MKMLAWTVSLAVMASSSGARAQEVRVERSRGPVSVVGLALLALGVGGAGLGLSGLLTVSDTQGTLAQYTSAGAPTTSDDAAAASRLEARLAQGTTLAAVGWSVAGLGLMASLILLLVDAPAAPAVPRLALVPLGGGGGLISYSLSW